MPDGWDIQETGAQPVEIVIGMRWTALWRLVAHPWVPLAFARMVRPGRHRGLLASRLRVTRDGPAISQDWQDRASLDDWSRSAGAGHLEPWMRFSKQAGGTADWGIWHRVRATQPSGGRAGHLVGQAVTDHDDVADGDRGPVRGATPATR